MISVNLQSLIDWLSKLGFGGLLVLALVGFQQGWWVFGREVMDVKAALGAMTKDRDEWKARALASMHAADRVVSAASEVVQT